MARRPSPAASAGPEHPKRPRKATGRPFQPGQSGNPRGRAAGSRPAALLALDAIGQEGAEAIVRQVVKMAQSGDARAAELVLARSWPARRGRLLALALPPLRDPADAADAAAALVRQVAAGDVTPEEAGAVAGLVEAFARTAAVAQLAERLAVLEALFADREAGRL